MLRKYVSSSMVLIVATVLALIVANSGWREAYEWLWQQPVSFSIGGFNLFSHGGHPLTLGQFINDFLMALFFFSVGLEIKREMLVGELSTVKKALLPIIGACGGMLVPVLVFALLCPSDAVSMRGMAIPMATDIAFSLGVLSMFGSRVPMSLKIFLAALAVADDLGGIIVIALFYATEVSSFYLFMALAVLLVLVAGNKLGLRAKTFYLAVGLVLWYMLLNSGVHATIAGVATAFCVPATLTQGSRFHVNNIRQCVSEFPIFEGTHSHDNRPIVLSDDEIQLLRSIEVSSDNLISPLQDLEDDMRYAINFIVIPLFAFASAGVVVNFATLGSDLFSGVGLSVMLGLLIGKVLGIFSFSWAAIKLGLVTMPAGTTWRAFASVCMLGGIGFTVSMFIATLSYNDAAMAALLNSAKMGILMGSLLSGCVAYVLLNTFLPKEGGSCEV